MKKLFIVLIIAISVFGFVCSNNAQASPISLQWTSTCLGNWTFALDLESVSTPAGDAYTLDGIATYLSGNFPYPVRGGAIYDSARNLYMVTLIFTSSTGETFTFGAAVDPLTLSGSGTSQRIAHGGVSADCHGTLSVAP